MHRTYARFDEKRKTDLILLCLEIRFSLSYYRIEKTERAIKYT